MERDHRKLNIDQHYFVIDEEVGKGLPLWMPNGTVIREELEKLAKEQEFLDGYDRVSTPHITRENLYHTSGHLPYYANSMFPPMEVDVQFAMVTFHRHFPLFLEILEGLLGFKGESVDPLEHFVFFRTFPVSAGETVQ